jgi:catechol 2,3-dioxygenase-like lactoylglutathione lyase family enzyme
MELRSLNVGAVIPVSDLAASRAFYESTLGLRGEPAPGGWVLHAGEGTRIGGASVVGHHLALADAYATALVLRGEPGPELVRGSPYEAVIVTLDGRMLASPGFPLAEVAEA